MCSKFCPGSAPVSRLAQGTHLASTVEGVLNALQSTILHNSAAVPHHHNSRPPPLSAAEKCLFYMCEGAKSKARERERETDANKSERELYLSKGRLVM